MKTLYILRHAKSDWSDLSLSDHDRSLNARGRDAATKIGTFCLAKGYAPDLVLCSTAARTRETLMHVQKAGGFDWQVQYEKDLYLAPSHTMISMIRLAGQNKNSLMLIAHNPGIHDLVLRLVRDAQPADMASLRAKYPTGALAEISFSIDNFADLRLGSGRLQSYITPKTLD